MSNMMLSQLKPYNISCLSNKNVAHQDENYIFSLLKIIYSNANAVIDIFYLSIFVLHNEYEYV